MSVANEINRIKTNIANAYTKAEEKGATLPTEKNSANLADTIASITAGGGVDKPAEGQSGIVVYAINSLGEVIPNAAVNLEEAGGTATFGSTDENGRYYEEVFVGTWTVYMSGVVEGFDLPASQTVETKANEITTIYMIYEEQSGSTTIPGGVTDTLKGVLDGSLTELDTTNLGITKIDQYKFYNNRNLTSVNLTGVTSIYSYAFSGCTSVTDLKLNALVDDIGSQAFKGCSSITNELICEFNNSDIGVNSFDGCTKARCNFTGTLEFLRSYAFQNFGKDRTNPQDNINVFDFRNGTFTTISANVFYYNKYSTIRLPNTLKSLEASVLAYCTNCNIYFYGETPPTVSNSNTFTGIGTATKIFAPYKSVNKYRTTTNWTSIATYIKGFAPENTFVAGEELPLYDTAGYGLTWYSDETLTTVITTMPAEQQEIYCTAGTEIVAYKFDVASYNANVTATDGVKIYKNGDMVANGTILTITANGTDNNTEKYYFTVNDVDFTSGSTTTVTDGDIDVACIYYDGINPPFTASLAEASWEEIKTASDAGVIKYVWEVGSTKPVTLTNSETYNVRFTDGLSNRYLKTDGTGSSNSVFEFVELQTTKYKMNSSSINLGGWNASYMNTTVMPLLYDLLPSDLKSVISQVKVPTANGGNQSGTTIVETSNNLFLPSEVEIFGVYTNSRQGEGEIFDYYVGKDNADRTKYPIAQDTGNYNWWFRSPYSRTTDRFCAFNGYTYKDDYYVANTTNNVALFFAI